MRTVRILLIGSSLLAPVSGAAQNSEPRGSAPQPEQKPRLELRDAELKDSIQAMENILRRRIRCERACDEQLRGRITFSAETPEQAKIAFETVLELKGWKFAERPGGELEIVPSDLRVNTDPGREEPSAPAPGSY